MSREADNTLVVTQTSLTVFLAYDSGDGAFCCQYPYNSTSGQCQVASGGSTQPFSLDPFQVIVDRSTGKLLPLNGSDATPSESTNSSAATTTVTATTTATGQSSIVPIAAGIAAPLGILLIAALVACGVLFSQLRKLRRERNDHGMVHQDSGHAAPMTYDYKVAPQEHRAAYSPVWAHQNMSPPPPAPVEAPSTIEAAEADSTPVKSSYR
ncbi:hypothetical protein LTR53_004736 [Teratosphaeriaceae sp. CCFEE 6253]|nr:hypothetical protein LTR53_004736 [Teratosphaeriaceae sp. CCFEE 6253]